MIIINILKNSRKYDNTTKTKTKTNYDKYSYLSNTTKTKTKTKYDKYSYLSNSTKTKYYISALKGKTLKSDGVILI